MSKCTNGNYTAPNGLKFNVACGRTAAVDAFTTFLVADLPECLNSCANYNTNLCFGVNYNSDDRLCSITGQGITTAPPSDANASALALANFDQLRPLQTDCPYPNGSRRNTLNGMPYRVVCDRTYEDSNMSPTNPALDDIHTATLDECMAACSSAHPLCLAVVWVPTHSDGFNNCNLKGTSEEHFLKRVVSAKHVAMAEEITRNETCSDGEELTVGEKRFRVSCLHTSDGRDLNVSHEEDLGACVRRCAEFGADNGTSCCAAVYDGSLRGGFENCYLRGEGVSLRQAEGFAIAVLEDSSLGPEPGPSAQAGPGASGKSADKTPVIAGSVAGGIATVIVVVIALLWWRKRRRRVAEAVYRGSEPPKHSELPVYPRELDSANKICELHDSNTIQTRPYEMESR